MRCYSSDFASWIVVCRNSYLLYLKIWLCAHGAVSVPYEFLAALHQIKIYALIPNSWFRRFCRIRCQKRWTFADNMEDTVFAWELSKKPGPSQLCLWIQRDTYSFGPRLRLGFKPPRECQCASCTLFTIATGKRRSVSGAYGFCVWESECSKKCSMHACKHTHKRYTDT